MSQHRQPYSKPDGLTSEEGIPPHRRVLSLWTAVLMQAVSDYVVLGKLHLWHLNETRRWFMSPSTDVGSYRWICKHLGRDADKLWEQVQKMQRLALLENRKFMESYREPTSSEASRRPRRDRTRKGVLAVHEEDESQLPLLPEAIWPPRERHQAEKR